jgi:hypothetical protein
MIRSSIDLHKNYFEDVKFLRFQIISYICQDKMISGDIIIYNTVIYENSCMYK